MTTENTRSEAMPAIFSMTAFGASSITIPQGTLTLDIRSVNSRYLDLHFRLPDELRQLEYPIRERLGQRLQRGKVEVRAVIKRQSQVNEQLDVQVLARISELLKQAQTVLPHTPAPRLAELLTWTSSQVTESDDVWLSSGLKAIDDAIEQLIAHRAREGARLVDVLLTLAKDIEQRVNTLEKNLPSLMEEQKQRSAKKLQEALQLALPNGLQFVSGPELSERLAHENSLFNLRVDVAEELARLHVHLKELNQLLHKPNGKPVGKRLDFLFQEMNREANTLGSKAGDITVTQTAMDLKLLIEQMREQIQNLE